MKCETLVLVLGDQLSVISPALKRVCSDNDRILMLEVREEAEYVPQHKIRLVLFFSAMRHFRDELRERGYKVEYTLLDDPENRGSIEGELVRRLEKLKPERLVCVEPGDHRVQLMITTAAEKTGTEIEFVDDTHFMTSITAFRDFASERKSLLMEYFYRDVRRKTGILMSDNQPVGGQWNFDKDNRDSFGKSGPPEIKAPRQFDPDDITRQVIGMVETQFPEAPGHLKHFDYPVTRDQASAALQDFVTHRLHGFGQYQDAMAMGRPYLFHSRLSSALNMHLLDPRDAVEAALGALDNGTAELNSVEGFIRQIIGWREFVRGIYWTRMPGYADANELEADLDMPEFMWSGETDMMCVRQSVTQLIDHAYAHHIQRLMVLGLFSLLLGVRPYDVHRWHMSMYVDAIDWVSLPNVLGMSQYGDGGIVGTKPYAASGNYISRMSNYCTHCRFNPKKATGDDACPITTLYWDFLSRNRNKLGSNRRMGFQFKNLDRKDDGERRDIRLAAEKLRTEFTRKTYL
ncbi:MAG: cryptochrome/photolyase family protein [Anderseniella sp.]